MGGLTTGGSFGVSGVEPGVVGGCCGGWGDSTTGGDTGPVDGGDEVLVVPVCMSVQRMSLTVTTAMRAADAGLAAAASETVAAPWPFPGATVSHV